MKKTINTEIILNINEKTILIDRGFLEAHQDRLLTENTNFIEINGITYLLQIQLNLEEVTLRKELPQ